MDKYKEYEKLKAEHNKEKHGDYTEYCKKIAKKVGI